VVWIACKVVPPCGQTERRSRQGQSNQNCPNGWPQIHTSKLPIMVF
jgi:hypothetical protein